MAFVEFIQTRAVEWREVQGRYAETRCAEQARKSLKTVIARVSMTAELDGAYDAPVSCDDPIVPLPAEEVAKQGRCLRVAGQAAEGCTGERALAQKGLCEQL